MQEYPKSFTREEMLVSATGVRLGIKNIPHSQEVERNICLMANVLQDLRDKLAAAYGKELPITVLSCYRSAELNKAVGGSKSSAHLRGLAADIRVKGLTSSELAHFIRVNMKYDQLILEFPSSANTWCHLGITEDASKYRQQSLIAEKVKGVTKYSLAN